MDWMEDLQARLQAEDVVQVSIDGQIWTIDKQNGMYTFTNEFGRQESFRTPDQLVTALQSWYESPTIVVL